MAKKKLGKLSFDASPDGLNFRWGANGESKHISLGPLNKLLNRGVNGEYDDGYDDRGYDEDDGRYDDVYDGDSRYAARDYDDGDYDDEYDDYDDRRDDRYDEYDDGYDDRRYDDDDRYHEPDDEPYYEPGYRDDNAPGKLDALWDFLDDYPWIVYVLLVLLPPLGIYLLWRQGMFDFTIRAAVSVVSGIWFIILLIWLFSGLTGGGNDPQVNAAQPPVGINLSSPTATIAPTDDPLDTQATPEAGEPTPTLIPGTSAVPTATALASQDNQTGTQDSQTGSEYVYSPTTGAYYHKNATCSSIGTTAVTQVQLSVAEARGQSQCPTCYGSTTYYMTERGTYYHSNPTCTDMKDAQSVTKTVATKAGKTPCPECIREFYISSASPYYHSKSNCSSITNASQTTVNAAKAAGKTACPTCVGSSASPTGTQTPSVDYSKPNNKYDAGVIVYAKKGGSNYHRSTSCTGSGMSGGQKITLWNAINLGYTACSHCLADGNDTVYCDGNGKRYHSTSSCSAASKAVKTSRGKALAVGAEKCSKCWGTADNNGNGNNDTAVTPSGPSVYITSENNDYHTRKACNGMKDPTKISLREAMAMGKDACNDCAGQANFTVYAASGDSKYHYSSTCSQLKGKPTKGTLAMALADELDACSVCTKDDSSANGNNSTDNGDNGNVENDIVDHSGISVYITQSGDDYHSNTSCSKLGAEEYYKVSLGVADARGKEPCSKCCATASHKVYSSAQDSRYHFDKNCSLLPGTPKSATLARALMDGLKACSACTKDDDSATVEGTPAPDIIPVSESTSGKKVYVTKAGNRYHLTKSCTKIGNQEVKGVSLETAKNYSLSACSTCASIASRKVYGSVGDRYYHAERTCNGVRSEDSGTLEKALLAGLKACPICVSGSGNNNSNNNNSNNNNNASETTPVPTTPPSNNGGSAPGDTKVYIDLTDDSAVYHKTSRCSKLNDATGVTLNYVLDFNFKPCTKCNPPTSVE